MNRGLVNLVKLRKNFDKADFKQGKSSYCFIDGNRIIKVYAQKYEDDFFPSEVCNFSKYKSDTIVFPTEYIYENGHIVGEISTYIKSQNITHSFDKEANLDKMINGYDLVLQDIYTYTNIDMVDLCSVNILYSNELGFHIIDTTEWKIVDDAHLINLHRFNSSLISEIVEFAETPISYSKYYSKIDDDFYNNMVKFGKAGKELQDSMKLLMHNRFNFQKLIYAYMDMYRTYSGKDAKTLEDVKELTKVLKKG